MGALGTRIESAELDRLRRVPTEDLDAYELFVRARSDFYAFTRESHARSRELVEQALALDPELPAPGRAPGRARAGAVPAGLGRERARLSSGRAPLRPRGGRARRRPRACRTRRWRWRHVEGRLEEAVQDARTAVELGPNSDVCLGVQAAVLSESGRYLDALRSLDRALRLNPRHPELYWLMAGFLHAQAGRRELGLELIERVRIANPDMVPPRLALGVPVRRRRRAGARRGARARDPAHQPRPRRRSGPAASSRTRNGDPGAPQGARRLPRGRAALRPRPGAGLAASQAFPRAS